MPAPKLFVADERGLGGRQLLQQQFLHMIHNIRNSSACLDTGIRTDEVLRNRMLKRSLTRQTILRSTPYHRKVPQHSWGCEAGIGRVDNKPPERFAALWHLPINSGIRERTLTKARRRKLHSETPPPPSPPTQRRQRYPTAHTPWDSSTSPLSTDGPEMTTQSFPVSPSYYGGEVAEVNIDFDVESGVYFYDLAGKTAMRTGATERVRLADERRAVIAQKHRQISARREARRQIGVGVPEDSAAEPWRLSAPVREAVLQALGCIEKKDLAGHAPHPPQGVPGVGSGVSNININPAPRPPVAGRVSVSSETPHLEAEE